MPNIGPYGENYDEFATGFEDVPNLSTPDEAAITKKLLNSKDPKERAAGQARIAENNRALSELTHAQNPEFTPVGSYNTPNPYNPNNLPLDTVTGGTAETAIPPIYPDIRQAAESNIPGAAIAQQGPVDISAAAANARAKTAETLKAPTQVGGQSYRDWLWDMHQRGIPLGPSIGILERLYLEGDPQVKNLAGIDEFMRKIPKGGERARQQMTLGLVKPANALGGLISENIVGPTLGRVFPSLAHDPAAQAAATEAIAKFEEQQIPLTSVPSRLNAFYNMAPQAIGEIPLWEAGYRTVAAPGIFAGLARLPRWAEATAEVANMTKAARLGHILREPEAAITKRFMEARRLADFGGQVATGVGISTLEGHDPKEALIGNALLIGGAFLGGALFRKIGGKMGYADRNLGRTLDYISEKTGIPATTLHQDMNHFGAIYSKLKDINAPDAVLKNFFDGVPGHQWNREVGTAFGRYLADIGSMPEDVQKVISFLPKEAQDHVFNTWGRAVKQARQFKVAGESTAARAARRADAIKRGQASTADILSQARTRLAKEQVDLAEEQAYKIEGGRKDFVYYTPTTSTTTVAVHPVGEEINGGQIYRDPLSKTGLGTTVTRTPEEVLRGEKGTHGYVVLQDGSKHVMRSDYPVDANGDIRLGDGSFRHVSSVKDVLDYNGKSKLVSPSVVNKDLKNPVTVIYDPTKETWAMATIRQLSRPSTLGKQALYLLNRYRFNSPEEYQAVAKELAMRVAGRSGWGSIIAKGKMPNDAVYVDLAGHGGGDVSEIAKKIEASAIRRAKAFFDKYPMIIGPVVGASALLGVDAYLNAKEAKAADWGAIRKLLSHVADQPWSEVSGETAAALAKGGKEGMHWGVLRTKNELAPLGDATPVGELVDRLEDVYKRVNASPEKLKAIVRRTPDHVDSDLFPNSDHVHIVVTHPDMPNKVNFDRPGNVIDFTGYDYGDGILKHTHLDGYGEEILGNGAALRMLRQVHKEGVNGWDAGDRVTGVAIKYSKGKRRSKALIKYGVPIAVGYGLTADPSDAAMLPGPLKDLIANVFKKTELYVPRIPGKAARDVEEAVLNLGPHSETEVVDPIVNMLNTVYRESNTTGHILENIIERRAAMTGTARLDNVIEDYGKVVHSLKELPVEIRPSVGEDAVPSPDSFVDNIVYHGTPRVYGAYDPKLVDPEGLYGPGLYTTSKAEIAGGDPRLPSKNIGYSTIRRTAVGGRPDTGIEKRPNVRPMRIKPGTKFVDVDANMTEGDIESILSNPKILKIVARSAGLNKPPTNVAVAAEMENWFKPLGVYERPKTWDRFYEAMANGWVFPGAYVTKAKLRKIFEELGYDGITHVGGMGDATHHRVWILFYPNLHTEPAFGLAATPTKAWARIVHYPTLTQDVASREKDLLKQNIGAPYGLIANDPTSLKVLRKGRLRDMSQRALGTSRIQEEYGAGLEQREGTTFLNIDKAAEAGILEFEIGHDLADSKIARIGGYIDPIDHHWYVKEKDAADWGIGKKALDSLVEAGIAAGIIKGLKTNYKALALVAAVTGAATLLGAGPANAMPPFGKWFAKGPKGMPIVDDWISDLAYATSKEGVTAATNAAKETAKARTPNTFTDTAEGLFAAGDIAPERVLSPEFRDILTLGHDPREVLTTASDVIKLPAYALDDPHMMGVRVHANYVLNREEIITGTNSLAQKAVRELDDIFGDTKLDIDELLDAADGLVRDGSTGALRQTKQHASAEATRIARRLVEEIDDPIFEFYHGIHPQAQAILREAKLEETEDTWKMLRWLQGLDVTQGTPLWGNRKVTTAEQIVAAQTKGMLHWEDWHDLDTASSSQGILSKFHLANEQAQLLREVKRLSDLYPNGVPQAEASKFNAIKTRLIELKAEEDKLRIRKNVSLSRVGKKHFWGPRAEAKELGLRIGLENDPRKIMSHYIHGALGQGLSRI